MSEKLNPVTREEMFLAKAAGQNTPDLKPITRVERFMQNLIDHVKSIGTGGSGGGMGGADWNAAEGEPGHVLNRPFYSEYETKTLLEETTLTVSEEEGMEGLAIIPYVVDLTGVPEVEVTYNGTKYVCPVTIDDSEGMVRFEFGDRSLMGDDIESTGEPFVAIFFDATSAGVAGVPGVIAALDGSAEFTISIVGNAETVHPIPEKYLPELRGQKQIIIDIDNQTASIPFETAWEMSVNELQVTITLRYNSIESAAMVVRRQEESHPGIELKRLRISFANIGTKDEPLGIFEVDWQSVNGETEIVFTDSGNRFFIPVQTAQGGHILFSAPVAGGSPNQWASPDSMVFSTIQLRSKSGKVFRITVDDNGNLTAT